MTIQRKTPELAATSVEGSNIKSHSRQSTVNDALRKRVTHPSDKQIQKAIEALKASGVHGIDYHSESFDSVRIAYQWLDAQNPSKGTLGHMALKHAIESWGGRYVSDCDVRTAAHLLGLKGRYPAYHLSRRLVRPSLRRLAGIKEAGMHRPTYTHDEVYQRVEGVA